MFLLTVGNLAATSFVASCDSRTRQESPDLSCDHCNLILVTLTNTRKDHLGPYGYPRETSPEISSFFRNGLVFENAWAPAPWTLPVAASLHTAQFPQKHGVMNRYEEATLPRDLTTLAELMRSAGYATAGFTGGGDYNRRYGFSRGFDVYVDEDSAKPVPAFSGIQENLPMVLEWLDSVRGQPFFLVLQGFDTHCPFTPLPPYDRAFGQPVPGEPDFSVCMGTPSRSEPVMGEDGPFWTLKTWESSGGLRDVALREQDLGRMIDLYDGEIAQADAALGRLFSQLEQGDLTGNTLVVFMSEHGDLFGEHGRFMRGGPLPGTFYEPVLNFPLLVRHPRVASLRRVPALIETVDLMPTFLEILGVKDESATERQGRSLLGDITRDGAGREAAFAGMTYVAPSDSPFPGTSMVGATRNREWKLVIEKTWPGAQDGPPASESCELYNLTLDPKEYRNLCGTEPAIEAQMKQAITQWSTEAHP